MLALDGVPLKGAYEIIVNVKARDMAHVTIKMYAELDGMDYMLGSLQPDIMTKEEHRSIRRGFGLPEDSSEEALKNSEMGKKMAADAASQVQTPPPPPPPSDASDPGDEVKNS